MEGLLEDLKLYIGNDYDPADDELLATFLGDAIEKVVNKIHKWPFKDDDEKEAIKTEALNRYPSVIRALAQCYYDRRGIFGVSSFTGNGETMIFLDEQKILASVIPMARIVR